MTGNASARPFRGELILRWQLCWTPKPGTLDRCFSRTHSTDLPASVPRSIHQMANDFLVQKYIRAARKKFRETGTDFGHQPYPPGEQMRAISFNCRTCFMLVFAFR